MKRSIITTGDGSSSLLVHQMGETFHSRHGAVQESLHVYIKNGLELIEKPEINILEFGFGTGLNALLTAEYAQENRQKIFYETIEAYPLQQEEYELLNYDEFANTSIVLNQLHETEWNKPEVIHPYFTVLKHLNEIETFHTDKKFDLIYFDVFGYEYQPELWSKEIFQKAFDVLNPQGILVTYACKGIVNRTLKAIGFKVEKPAGALGKREMTRAVKVIE